jgi:hypothetical protein
MGSAGSLRGKGILFKRVFNAVIVSAAVVVTAGVALSIWLVWFAPPHVRMSIHGDQVVFDNVVLGEYYLGFEEVTIRNSASGELIWHMQRDGGEAADPLSLRVGLNKTPPGWTVIGPKNSGTFNLLPGGEYQVTVWGNNGFARRTKWRRPLIVPGNQVK